jgi:hypothetical protein
MLKKGTKVKINLPVIEEKGMERDTITVVKFLNTVADQDYLIITSVFKGTEKPYIVNDYIGFSEEELIIVEN